MNVLQKLRNVAQEISDTHVYDIGNEVFSRPRYRAHDWRNHLHSGIEAIWEDLSEEARLVAFILAEEAADNEEWE